MKTFFVKTNEVFYISQPFLQRLKFLFTNRMPFSITDINGSKRKVFIDRSE